MQKRRERKPSNPTTEEALGGADTFVVSCLLFLFGFIGFIYL